MNTARPDFDLAIIGGGPAGACAAISAVRYGARVALFDAGEFPRHKVCGEFISAESLGILRDLLRNVPDASRVLAESPVIDKVRLLLDDASTAALVSPAGLSLTRYG